MRERITGKKIMQRQLHFGKCVEAQYRVEEFIAFFPGRGSTGGGLVQFNGLRATRMYMPGEERPAWNVETEVRKHTVEMTSDTQLVKARPRRK